MRSIRPLLKVLSMFTLAALITTGCDAGTPHGVNHDDPTPVSDPHVSPQGPPEEREIGPRGGEPEVGRRGGNAAPPVGELEGTDELGETFSEALSQSDLASLEALFPTRAQLEEALQCPEGKGLWKTVNAERERLDRAMKHVAGASIEWIGLADASTQGRALPVGSKLGACTTKLDLSVLNTRFKLKGTRDGVTQKSTIPAKLLKLADGVWYIIDL